MALLELVIPLTLVLVVLLGVLVVLPRGGRRELAAPVPSRWVTAHVEHGGTTLVLVRRVAQDDHQVLDERVVASIAASEPDYDERFLEAMELARNRAALYDSEEER